MADDEKPTTIYAPDGIHRLGASSRERVELRPGLVEWFRQWADVGAAFKLGVHCALCGQDIRGLNSDADRVFIMSCGCREFVGANRDRRPRASVQLRES